MKKFAHMLLLYLAASVCQAAEHPDAGLANFARQVSILADPAHGLASRLITETLGLDLIKHCKGPVPNRDGDYYRCLFKPRIEQRERFRFVEFSSLSMTTPEPDSGGAVTWTVDQKAGCLTKESLMQAFNRRSSFPRYPSVPEFFLSNQLPEVYNSYDLILHEYLPEKENIFIAIFETRRCAVKIKLYKN